MIRYAGKESTSFFTAYAKKGGWIKAAFNYAIVGYDEVVGVGNI
jgi:hypothetical protein